MDSVERLLIGTPRRRDDATGDLVLAHYTGYPALNSIVERGELWATDIHYLNDELEYKHGFQILRQIFEEKIGQKGWNIPAVLKLFDGCVGKLSRLQIHIVSFSENNDLLSQWRGYTPAGGVSIDFSFKHLQDVCNELASGDISGLPLNVAFQLLPCVYDNKKKKDIAEAFLSSSSILESDEILIDRMEPAMQKMVTAFSLYSSLFKHSGFDEEREWRLVSGPIHSRHDRVAFYAAPGLLRPYFRFDLHLKGKRLEGSDDIGVRRLTVSPSVRQDLMCESVFSLFAKHQVYTKYPTKSETPYRTL